MSLNEHNLVIVSIEMLNSGERRNTRGHHHLKRKKSKAHLNPRHIDLHSFVSNNSVSVMLGDGSSSNASTNNIFGESFNGSSQPTSRSSGDGSSINASSQPTGPSSSRISSLDANPSTNTVQIPIPTGNSPSGNTIPTGTYYADDDSIVSSNVSDIPGDTPSSDDGSGDPEVATLTRAVDTDLENANEPPQERDNKGILPRSRREWCIVWLAILLILAVALGIGLGLGFYFMNKDGDEKTGVERGNPTRGPESDNTNSGDNNVTKQDDNSTSDNDSYWPTYSPSGSPTVEDSSPTIASSTPQLEKPMLTNDLASAIEYHVISQEISNIASFAEMAGDVSGGTVGGDSNGSPTTLSAQEQARDFLVLRDFLPMAVMDEEDDEPTNNNNGGDDDPLATSNEPRRPYLTTTSPAYRVAQRFATTVLYYATDGGNWETNQLWLEPGVHECDFIGVTCEELSIPAVTLEEVLENPEEIPRHDDGSVDGLWSNQIGGSLPGYEVYTWTTIHWG
mmetsp:Transcript_18584/g.33626  ORF Transcript_18584/g.33626 Transcript_18584/m.33626 type:complete len:507 (+) Transcript_18584:99-1619(+)